MAVYRDDRIADPLDEGQRQLIGAATPAGFQLRQPQIRPLVDYNLQTFERPASMTTHLTGQVGGVPVDVFDYSWVKVYKRRQERGTRVVLVLRDPRFEGEACCSWEDSQTLVAKTLKFFFVALVVLAAFWVVLPLVVFQRARGKTLFGRDCRVGDPAFDNRFRVDSPSRERAVQALPLTMQQLVVAEGLRGPIEVAPGQLALGLQTTPLDPLDPQSFERARALAYRVLEAYGATRPQSGPAYRIADDPARPSPAVSRADVMSLTPRHRPP